MAKQGQTDAQRLKEFLEHSKKDASQKFAIYYNNAPVFIWRSKNVYKSAGIARRVLANHAYVPTVEIDALLTAGILEIKPIK